MEVLWHRFWRGYATITRVNEDYESVNDFATGFNGLTYNVYYTDNFTEQHEVAAELIRRPIMSEEELAVAGEKAESILHSVVVGREVSERARKKQKAVEIHMHDEKKRQRFSQVNYGKDFARAPHTLLYGTRSSIARAWSLENKPLNFGQPVMIDGIEDLSKGFDHHGAAVKAINLEEAVLALDRERGPKTLTRTSGVVPGDRVEILIRQNGLDVYSPGIVVKRNQHQGTVACKDIEKDRFIIQHADFIKKTDPMTGEMMDVFAYNVGESVKVRWNQYREWAAAGETP